MDVAGASGGGDASDESLATQKERKFRKSLLDSKAYLVRVDLVQVQRATSTDPPIRLRLSNPSFSIPPHTHTLTPSSFVLSSTSNPPSRSFISPPRLPTLPPNSFVSFHLPSSLSSHTTLPQHSCVIIEPAFLRGSSAGCREFFLPPSLPPSFLPSLPSYLPLSRHTLPLIWQRHSPSGPWISSAPKDV